MPNTFPLPPTDSPDIKKLVRQISEILGRAMNGKTNNVLEVTLTANAASTTVSDDRLTSCSAISLTPLTANAAAALATTYVDDTNRVHKSVIITHANNAQTDRTFRAVFVG